MSGGARFGTLAPDVIGAATADPPNQACRSRDDVARRERPIQRGMPLSRDARGDCSQRVALHQAAGRAHGTTELFCTNAGGHACSPNVVPALRTLPPREARGACLDPARRERRILPLVPFARCGRVTCGQTVRDRHAAARAERASGEAPATELVAITHLLTPLVIRPCVALPPRLQCGLRPDMPGQECTVPPEAPLLEQMWLTCNGSREGHQEHSLDSRRPLQPVHERCGELGLEILPGVEPVMLAHPSRADTRVAKSGCYPNILPPEPIRDFAECENGGAVCARHRSGESTVLVLARFAESHGSASKPYRVARLGMSTRALPIDEALALGPGPTRAPVVFATGRIMRGRTRHRSATGEVGDAADREA